MADVYLCNGPTEPPKQNSPTTLGELNAAIDHAAYRPGTAKFTLLPAQPLTSAPLMPWNQSPGNSHEKGEDLD